MTQSNSVPNSLVNWQEAELFAKRVGNENPIWVVFPPKRGGYCSHYPTIDGVIPKRKIERMLGYKPKHSLGIIVNPSRTKPKGFGERDVKEDRNDMGDVRTWGAKNDDIGGSRVVFLEGDAGLPFEEQFQIIEKTIKVPVSFVVQTGSKSLHFYWVIADACLLPHRSRELQIKLGKLVDGVAPELGVDSSTHSPCQIMRCPGYKHGLTGKQATFYQDIWLDKGGEDYAVPLSEIETLLDDVEISPKQIRLPVVKSSPGVKKGKFISQEALDFISNDIDKESGWFTRLAKHKHRPLAVEMLSKFVVKRDVTGEGQRKDCIKVLCGLLNFFGEEETISIVNESKWESPYWDPIKEIKSLHPPYTNQIGNLVHEAKKGKGPKWVYENSPVINGDTSGIVLEEVFPAELSKHLRVICKYLPYPDYLVISSFLSAVASCLRLGTSLVLVESSNFKVPLNLFSGAVGRSGTMKSPLVEQLIKNPLQLVEEEVNAKYKRQMAQWLNDKNNDNSNDGELPEPVRTFVFIKDTTEASMEKQLQNQEQELESLLVLRDELSGLFVFDKEKTRGGTQHQQYLELFDGSGFKTIRLERNKAITRTSEKSQVSIFGALQDQVLAKLISQGDPTGLFARFLLLPLPSIAIKLAKYNEQQKQEAREARSYLQNYLLKIKRLIGFTYYLSDEATDKFIDFDLERKVKAIHAESNKIAHAATYGKSSGKVGRLAGLIHIVRTAEDPEEFVQEDTLNQAIKIVEFADKFIIEFENRNNESDEDKLMQRLLSITDKAKSHMAYRDISAGLTPKERKRWDKEMIEKTLVKLAHMGFGETLKGSKGALHFKKLKNWE